MVEEFWQKKYIYKWAAILQKSTAALISLSLSHAHEHVQHIFQWQTNQGFFQQQTHYTLYKETTTSHFFHGYEATRSISREHVSQTTEIIGFICQLSQ